MKAYSEPLRRNIRGKDSRHYYTRERDTVTGVRRWINTRTGNLEAARETIRSLEIADRRGERQQQNSRLADAVAEWLRVKATRMTRRGYDTYRGCLLSWVEFYPPATTVRQITPEKVERYFLYRSKEVSASTVNKQRVLLKQFLRWCHDRGLIDDADPVRTVKKFREEKRAIRALSEAEQKGSWKHARDPTRSSLWAFVTLVVGAERKGPRSRGPGRKRRARRNGSTP